MIQVNALIGTHDILFITLDTLRYDVAQQCCLQGRIPNLAEILPQGGWEARHSPGNFTYAAHHAFFAGFLPTPIPPGKYPRPFALSFPASDTIAPESCVFETADIVSGLAERGYRTICIGGVEFFNKLTPLGSALPDLFQESHWSPEMGNSDPNSTRNQVHLATGILDTLPRTQRVFLFLNVSAIHYPNYMYIPGQLHDSLKSHAAALEYTDRQLGALFRKMRSRAPVYAIICADHGTAYGEDGYWGHRVSHPVVYTVPYAECLVTHR
ncbi:metalloenzyme domain-containing protein [candidate division KSB3 bacterium]|uniref:Metalloenzyme domain-containing protein n=1 Tax=candidate division KSB3 bacterium TaxID=2044937 RepID=A0A2G6E8P4_9BACT|nr:MAG: metalloenzyme domain-containing protein [candidate division KSB3 bacterium]PIE30536.1 MAG: metalloenzyme domain-containing protein [candidate division KSB3 bacterium]